MWLSHHNLLLVIISVLQRYKTYTSVGWYINNISVNEITVFNCKIKGIVHFEIKMWYLSAYPKGIQDVGVFFSSVDPILMFLGQTVLVCQSYNGRYRSLSL